MRLACACDLHSNATETNILECGDDDRAGDWHGLRAFRAVPLLDSLDGSGAAGDLVVGAGDYFSGDAGEPGIFDQHREICGEVRGAGRGRKCFRVDSDGAAFHGSGADGAVRGAISRGALDFEIGGARGATGGGVCNSALRVFFSVDQYCGKHFAGGAGGP